MFSPEDVIGYSFCPDGLPGSNFRDTVNFEKRIILRFREKSVTKLKLDVYKMISWDYNPLSPTQRGLLGVVLAGCSGGFCGGGFEFCF